MHCILVHYVKGQAQRDVPKTKNEKCLINGPVAYDNHHLERVYNAFLLQIFCSLPSLSKKKVVFLTKACDINII